MFFHQRDSPDLKDNSNNENDFKELDNEIDKVVRGKLHLKKIKQKIKILKIII